MTTKSGLKIIFDTQTTFYNLFDSYSFLYFDLDIIHSGTYITFHVIVLDLLLLIHFAQKKDTKEMLTFQNYWCLCSRWEEKARERRQKTKKRKSQVDNWQDMTKSTSYQIWWLKQFFTKKKSNYAKTSVKLTLFCKVNLY